MSFHGGFLLWRNKPFFGGFYRRCNKPFDPDSNGGGRLEAGVIPHVLFTGFYGVFGGFPLVTTNVFILISNVKFRHTVLAWLHVQSGNFFGVQSGFEDEFKELVLCGWFEFAGRV